MQRAGLNQREVGDQGAELLQVLDAAHQVAVGRVVFGDHGGARAGLLRDQHVHLVTVEGFVRDEGQAAAHLRGLVGVLEVIDMLDHVLLHHVQMGQHGGHIGEAGADVVQGVLDGQQRVVLVELLELLGALLAPARQHLQDLAQLVLQATDGRADALLLIVGQLVEVVGRDDLAVARGDKGEAARGAQQEDLLAFGFVAQGLERGFFTLAEGVLDGLGLGAVLVAFEQPGDGAAQVVHQLGHLVAQVGAPARGEAQGLRFVRLLEVVQVAPLGRVGLGGRLACQQLLHHAALAHARGALHIDVVALMAHAGAELHGLHRAHLADQLAQVFQLGGGLEIELMGIAGVVQLRGSQGGQVGHQGHGRWVHCTVAAAKQRCDQFAPSSWARHAPGCVLRVWRSTGPGRRGRAGHRRCPRRGAIAPRQC